MLISNDNRYKFQSWLQLDFAIFSDKDAGRGKVQRIEFRRKGMIYPSEEIHLAGHSLSLQMSSKILHSQEFPVKF